MRLVLALAAHILKVVRLSILLLFLVLVESFQLSILEYDVNYESVIYDFYYVDVHSLYTHFVESLFFIINGCWILSDAFFVSIEMIMCFIFQFIKWYITLIKLWMLNHSCILGINPTWLWYMILLLYSGIWFANILLRNSSDYLKTYTRILLV